MAEGDVGDGAATAHNANAALAATREGGDAIHDIATVGDLHDVSAEGVGAVARDDDGGFGFILGSGGSATWTAGVLAVFAVAASAVEVVVDVVLVVAVAFETACTALFVFGVLLLLLKVVELLLVVMLEIEVSCCVKGRRE